VRFLLATGLLLISAIALGCSGSSPQPGAGAQVQPVTSCAATLATYPPISGLTSIAPLPDPFLAMDGSPITSADQWGCRRAEIGGQAQTYELGPEPPPPDAVTGAYSGGQLTVTVNQAGKSISFTAAVTLPATGTPPYPAMIGVGGIWIGPDTLNGMGVATIVFPNDTIAAQQDGSSRGKGAFYDLYGDGHPAGALMAWSWGVSRLIDAIQTTPDAQIDPTRLGITGCSRNGKGALVAGAFDDRIALTIPQESGSGGAASWRVSDATYAAGTIVQTLSEIVTENVWFRASFADFAHAATQLPFDHHELEAMVAPRALLVIENTAQVWLGAESTFTNSMVAHDVWQALGIPDQMGFSQLGHPDHCGWSGAQQPEVTAYVQKFLVGGGTDDTNVLTTDGGFTLDRATWAPWDVPVL
jgi:hypothetical protein